MNAQAKQRSGQIVGKLLFGSLTLFTFGLGAWQTYRYFEVKPELAEENDPNLVHIRVGNLDLNRSILLGPRKLHTESKEYGYFVLTPSAKDALLVCIGWMPKTSKEPIEFIKPSTDTIAVHANRGEERGNYFSPPTPSPDGTFLWANRETMLLAVGLDPQTARIGETYEAISNQLKPKQKPEPYLTKWTHAGYATTWYSLTLAGWWMMRKMFKA